MERTVLRLLRRSDLKINSHAHTHTHTHAHTNILLKRNRDKFETSDSVTDNWLCFFFFISLYNPIETGKFRDTHRCFVFTVVVHSVYVVRERLDTYMIQHSSIYHKL